MSQSYRDQRTYKNKVFWKNYYSFRKDFNPWVHSKSRQFNSYININKCYKNNVQFLFTNYNNAPSWFTRQNFIKPFRRLDKIICHKIKLAQIDLDSVLFSLAHKPFIYYY